MSPKELPKRKRGRPPTHPPAASPLNSRKSSSRISSSNERNSSPRKSVSTPEPDSSQRTSTRKRGRPATYYPSHQEESNTKRRRDASPSSDKLAKGKEIEVDDDASDVDEVGETKIDKYGRLQGGRKYKVETFTLPDHGEELYMLARYPAQALAYRDSYLFFQRNPTLKRVPITDAEKNLLVEMKHLVSRFKNRDVAVVTARSVFKCFGSKIIKHGERIKDDYRETFMDEGQNPDGDSAYATGSTGYRKGSIDEDEDTDLSRKSLIGKTARSEGYSSKVPLSNETWMHHAALAARGFNAQLHERRAAKPTFYDIHSNVNQIPDSYQPRECRFELEKNLENKDEQRIQQQFAAAIEFKQKVDLIGRPQYVGLGTELLDIDVKKALEALSTREEEKTLVETILSRDKNIKIVQDDDDGNYPLAVTDGQFQSAFPVHQARFNYPVPKIPEPTIIVDTAQSLTAQQYYLGLVYQSVNQYADPSRQSPVGRASPSSYAPPPPQLQPQQMPSIQHSVPSPHTMQPPHIQQRISLPQAAEPAVCGTMMPDNQICRRPVNRIGEKCPHHGPIRSMNEFAKAPPPSTTYSDNKCADCHQLRAADSLFSNEEEHITDDFAVVKCAKCTRKYHPICANLTTPRQIAAVESYPWSCPECKICCVCRSAGDESTLMICDGCDRGWHTGCCNPKVDRVPEGSWLCPLCANCHSCNEHGMAEESQYTHAAAPKSDRYKYPVYLATYCPTCHDNFQEDRFCSVCLKTYSEEENNEDEDNEMVACDSCDHWVHTRCDESLTPNRYQQLCDDEGAKYSCPMCEERFKRIVDTSGADLALKGLSAPSGTCVGLLGGKVKTRGIVKYKDIRIGVPEINGAGVAEMPPKK